MAGSVRSTAVGSEPNQARISTSSANAHDIDRVSSTDLLRLESPAETDAPQVTLSSTPGGVIHRFIPRTPEM